MRARLRSPKASGLQPLYEFTWNHTTLHAIRIDPSITYLQLRFPPVNNLELVDWVAERFHGEVLLHLEFQRRFGKVTCSSLPLVRYSSAQRLDAIMAELDGKGVAVSNPHTFVLDNAGWKRVDAPQAEFKRMADPYGLMNPGKLKHWQAQQHAGDRVMSLPSASGRSCKSSEFAALDPNSTLAILPVAATEQHGPHLPVMTDTAIAEGMIKTVLARLPDELRRAVPARSRRSENPTSICARPARSPTRRTISSASGSRSARACIAPACASWSSSIRTAATTM